MTEAIRQQVQAHIRGLEREVTPHSRRGKDETKAVFTSRFSLIFVTNGRKILTANLNLKGRNKRRNRIYRR